MKDQATVSIPLSVYENEQTVIEKLERERITKFLKTEYISLEKNEYTMSIDMDKVNEFLDKHYPDRQKVTFRPAPASLYDRPFIRMTCMSCGHKERSVFSRIKNCPECDGLLVDPYDGDIMNKVLKKAGYVRVSDIQEQPLLSITLQDESSAPKVIYKGEEIKHKVNVNLDWETESDISGGLSYSIEHVERDNGYPAVNRIERRVRGHA